MEESTVAEALERLQKAGFLEDFRAEGGQLRSRSSEACNHPPEDFAIQEVVRFEGTTDPAEEQAIFALRCKPHGTAGTYVVAYGPSMPPDDVEIVRRLDDGRTRGGAARA